jgi:glycosyltransferase involved in cell wall biosynthesis
LNTIQPLVSICIPAYNAEKTLAYTLDSILKQNYKNVEILVSDNHSTDKTSIIVKEYEKYNIKYFLNPTKPDDLKNISSVVSNFNYLLSLAQGEFIALYHADDIYLPSIITQQVQFLQNNDIVGSVFTYSNIMDENEQNLKINTGVLPDQLNIGNIIDFDTLLNTIILQDYHLMFPTLMIRKEALLFVGTFNPTESFVSDIEYYLRLAYWKPIGLIKERLHNYRVKIESKSHIQVRQNDIFKHYIRFIEDYIKLPQIKERVNISQISFYKMILCSRKIFIIRQYLKSNNINEAKTLLESFKYEYIFLAFKRRKALKGILTGLILKTSFDLRIAVLVNMIIEKISKFTFLYWRRKLY